MVRNGVKIGLMGAGGTGKTTDAQFLAQEFQVPALKSSSRTIYERMGISEEDCAKMGNEGKWKLQLELFKAKIENDDKTFTFVADRTLLDHWAYCLMYCGSFLSNEDFEKYENVVRKHMQSTYSFLFYYPWGYWEAPSDGVRQDKKSWQSAIDAIITGYCIRWGLRVVTVPQTGGEDHRQEYVKNAVLGGENNGSN